MSVVIETTLGDITVDLYLKSRPNTCLNFLKLCKIKYYNLCVFHKVQRGFIAQTGDPTETGRGGESVFSHLYGDQAKYFDAELKPRLKHEKLGTLSMVNNGNNMNGSQFFITLGENVTYLDDEHTVFGEVAEGFETLLKINEAICDPNNRPYQDIRITHTVIIHDPYEDPNGLVVPDASPEPTKEQLESNYIGADEEIDDTKGKSMEEIEENIKENEAKARATILEMVGDIPDAEVKPPDDVLFVCKLNPVTTSEDLEVIFSRFGSIISCEVIKDKKTGESLQYAFIEFEKEEDCENAYFKMDNVLIDDRRIHVDFSQSVSKLNWKNWKDGKPPRDKSRKDNLVIKSSSKSDGYDMIFDMNDSPERASERKKHKEIAESSDYKSSSKSYNTDKYQSKQKARSSEFKNFPRSYDGGRHRSRQQSRSPAKRGENDYHHRKNYSPTKQSDSYRRNYKVTSNDYYSKSKSYCEDDRMSHQKSRNDHVSYNPKLREKEQMHAPRKESIKPGNYISKKKTSRSSSSSGSDSSDASPAKKSRKGNLKNSTSSDSDSSSSSSSHVNQHHTQKSHSSKSSSHKTTKKLDAHKYFSKSLSRSRSSSPEYSQKRTRKHSPPSSRKKRHDSSSERELSRSPRKEMSKHSRRSESHDGKRSKSKASSGQEYSMPPEYSSRGDYRTASKSETSRRDFSRGKDSYQKSTSVYHRHSSHDYESSHKKHSSKMTKHYRRSPS